jgi:NADH-quinone oxidoreductase subunit C
MSDAPTTDATEPEPAQEPALIHGAPSSLSRGQLVVFPPREDYMKIIEALKGDGYSFLSDLTAVDYLLHHRGDLPRDVVAERFEVVVSLLDMDRGQRIRVRVQVPEGDPTLPTLFEVFPGSETMEREVYDMFGVVFAAHPDMTRILMPDDWEGHPLRKDYPVARIPVQFKEAPATR